MGNIRFTKAQTNGNDFVIIYESPEGYSKKIIQRICDRRFGVGCDQLIFIKELQEKFELVFYNQDGTHAAMCGNGSAASIKYIHDKFRPGMRQYKFLVGSTLYEAEVVNDEISIYFPLPEVNGNTVKTGNLHKIFQMNEISLISELSERYKDFNLHFVSSVAGGGDIRVKTFERGVGWTMACGSGAVAIGGYLHSINLGRNFEIIQDGGRSQIEVLEQSVRLTTNPELVFEGEYDYGTD